MSIFCHKMWQATGVPQKSIDVQKGRQDIGLLPDVEKAKEVDPLAMHEETEGAGGMFIVRRQVLHD